MNATTLLSVAQILLALGIIVSVMAAFITSRGDSVKMASSSYYFAGQVFMTAFFAMRAATYAQQQELGYCVFMLLAVFVGLTSIIAAYVRKGRDTIATAAAK